MNKSVPGLIIASLLFVLSAPLQAGFIEWTYQATIARLLSSAGDPLNIDGETVTIALTLDDMNTWQDPVPSGSVLYFPIANVDVSISGGHTVGLGSPSPALGHFKTDLGAGIVEALGNPSYLDLVIDGNLTQMLSLIGDSTTIPSAGDRLLQSHLPTSSMNPQIDYPINENGNYEFVNWSITVGAVPEPATLALFGLGAVRRRKLAA